ncbi:hypothetical protein LZU01_01520, partial [Staphylococcus epidermidis]|nr:hypothetical protein [Staphylococcus epidermidis]
NIRKVTAQRAENNQKNNKKDNFYIISIEIVFFYLSWDFMSHTLYLLIVDFFVPTSIFFYHHNIMPTLIHNLMLE